MECAIDLCANPISNTSWFYPEEKSNTTRDRVITLYHIGGMTMWVAAAPAGCLAALQARAQVQARMPPIHRCYLFLDPLRHRVHIPDVRPQVLVERHFVDKDLPRHLIVFEP